MCLEDFKKNFNRLYVIRLYHDKIGKVWERYVIRGAWKGKKAGGCSNNATWKNNPQYAIAAKTKKTTKIFIELCQQDSLYNDKKPDTIGFVVIKVDNATKPLQQITSQPVFNRPFKTHRECNEILFTKFFFFLSTKYFSFFGEDGTELEILPGCSYVVVPSTFEPGIEESFTLTIYGEDPISVNELSEENSPRVNQHFFSTIT